MDDRILLFTIFLVLPVFSRVQEVSVLKKGQSLSPSRNQTVFCNSEFELGFFNPFLSGGNRWYVGIWYKNIPERSYVWVANRDTPLGDYRGTLSLIGGNLVIRPSDAYNSILWSTGIAVVESESSRAEVVAELLATGNLVVRYSDSDDFLWQSFDYPTDTLIPGMTLGVDTSDSRTADLKRSLKSWKSYDDPSSGFYTLTSRHQIPPELDIKMANGERVYRSGTWDGEKFIGLPRVFNVTWNSEGATACLYVATHNLSRLVLVHSGLLVQFEWNQNTKVWDRPWASPSQLCHSYNLCGDNSYCDMNVTPTPTCNCITGFERTGPKYDVTYGCRRKAPVNCGANKFETLRNMNFPSGLNSTVYKYVKKKRCRQICIEDCECTAYIVTNRSTCVLWNGNLVDLQRYSHEDLELHIKLDGKKKSNDGVIIGLAVSISVALIALAIYLYWKRRPSLARQEMGIMQRDIGTRATEMVSDPRLPPAMDFGVILHATTNFSNEIGHGGFGKVYKGRLRDGQEIAAKKLSKMSRQGIVEFRTEIELIVSLQHINLVRLIGWTVHEEEMVLVYEYLENGSLENHLFGGGQSSSELNWQRRYQVIKGIARGLTYLHHDSQVKTIHRDLKPGNILLNRDFIPKILDFGLARIFERNDIDAMTTHLAGTRGYMSPEYLLNGRYSLQSDTFSFGVMVLEIVSGKMNNSLPYLPPNTNFLSVVWKNWKEGNWQESVDEAIRDSSPSQVLRNIEIGLMCVQQTVEDRPLMSAVMSLLENETLEVPKPKPPGFFMDGGQSSNDVPSSSSKTYGECSTSSASTNRCTITQITAR